MFCSTEAQSYKPGSIPMRSFTAPRSRWLHPRYFSVVCTETCPTTPRNSQQHFDMLPTDPLAVSLDEGSSSSADEIGNLERRRGHWSTSSTTSPTLISKPLGNHCSARSCVASAAGRLRPNGQTGSYLTV